MACRKNQGLTEAEWKIMRAVWSISSQSERCLEWGVLIREVHDHLYTKQEKSINTVATQMVVLTRKGFLVEEKHGHQRFYRPLVSREQMVRKKIAHTIEIVGGVGKFLNYLDEMERSGEITPEQATPVRNFAKSSSVAR